MWSLCSRCGAALSCASLIAWMPPASPSLPYCPCACLLQAAGGDGPKRRGAPLQRAAKRAKEAGPSSDAAGPQEQQEQQEADAHYDLAAARERGALVVPGHKVGRGGGHACMAWLQCNQPAWHGCDAMRPL